MTAMQLLMNFRRSWSVEGDIFSMDPFRAVLDNSFKVYLSGGHDVHQ